MPFTEMSQWMLYRPLHATAPLPPHASRTLVAPAVPLLRTGRHVARLLRVAPLKAHRVRVRVRVS